MRGLNGTRLKNLGLDTYRLYSEQDMKVYTGNATLFVITALFPMIILIISIVTLIPGFSTDSVTAYLFRLVPDIPEIQSLLTAIIDGVDPKTGGLVALIAACTTLWSASAGISSIQRGLRRIHPVESSGIRDKIIALLFTLLYTLLIPAILIFQVLGRTIIDLVGSITDKLGLPHLGETLVQVIQVSGIIAIICGVFAILLTYTYLPGGRRRKSRASTDGRRSNSSDSISSRWTNSSDTINSRRTNASDSISSRRTLKQQIPGTIFACVLWAVFTMLFTFFVPRFYHASNVYGSLASLFLALLWLRIIMMIFYLGACMNQVLSKPAEE